MEVFQYLIDFFGITAITAESTFVDLLQYMFIVFGSLFLFTFILRSLFLLLTFGQR